VLAPKARNADEHARAVAALAGARLDQRVALETQSTHAAGISIAELGRRIGATPQVLAEPIARLTAGGELLAAGDCYIHATTIAELEQAILGGLSDPDVAREALRGTLPAALPQRAFDAIVDGLAQRNKLVATGDRVRSASAPVRGALSSLEASALAKLKESGIEPPRPKELAVVLNVGEAQLKPVLDRLVAAKLAVKIKPDLLMHASIVDDVRTRLVAFLAQHDTIDAQQWKDLTGASRKFTIPLAEYFDGEKLTLRVGDVRRRR
jgi:selenocysteine-specific elongation factor